MSKDSLHEQPSLFPVDGPSADNLTAEDLDDLTQRIGAAADQTPGDVRVRERQPSEATTDQGHGLPGVTVAEVDEEVDDSQRAEVPPEIRAITRAARLRDPNGTSDRGAIGATARYVRGREQTGRG